MSCKRVSHWFPLFVQVELQVDLDTYWCNDSSSRWSLTSFISPSFLILFYTVAQAWHFSNRIKHSNIHLKRTQIHTLGHTYKRQSMHALIKRACKQCLKSSPNIASLWKQTKWLEQCLISVWNSSANAHLPCPLSWLLFIN